MPSIPGCAASGISSTSTTRPSTSMLNHRIWWGWGPDIAAELAEGYAAATRAVSLDDRDPYTHYALSLISMLCRRHEQSLSEAQRAIDLNPNFALGYFALGWIRVHLGHF